MTERQLTVEEAATMLGRTPHAIYRMVARRQLPYRKAQKRLVFVESELQAFIRALPGVTLDALRERARAGV
jgi:excisionase family DNA binding protein